MTENADWDGIAKFRYTDPDSGEAQFDSGDEIHEELEMLIELWRDADAMTWEYQEGLNQAANDLEQVLKAGDRIVCSECEDRVTPDNIEQVGQLIVCSGCAPDE